MKFVFVDWGHMMFTALMGSLRDVAIPAPYRALSMMIAYLKMVGLTTEDRVIIAVDSNVGSWRKELDPSYRPSHKNQRLPIDWGKEFTKFKKVLDNLENTTPFHVIEIDRLEADDIIAYGCKKIQAPCVIISSDSGYEQLYAYENVKVFSPKTKLYKKVSAPYKVLAKKIIRDGSNNLTAKVVSEEDYEIRDKIVNLIRLPTEIEKLVDERLNVLPDKEWNMEDFCYPTLKSRLETIYSQDNVVSVYKTKPKHKKPVKQMYLFQGESNEDYRIQ